MKTLYKSLCIVFGLLAFASLGHAQTALTQTTITSAITTSGQQAIVVASATGISAPVPVTGNTIGSPTGSMLFIDGEAMLVTGVNGKFVNVIRGYSGTVGSTHAVNSVVWAGTPNQFYSTPPAGSCTAANTVNPYINVDTGQFWFCDSGSGNWQPVFSTGSITPAASSAAIQTAAQTFTVTGLVSGEPIVVVSQPAPTSLCPLVAARVTAANTVSLYFSTLTAAACTPAAGTYFLMAPRLNMPNTINP